MSVRTFLFLTLALLPSVSLPRCLAQAQNPALHLVRKIYVGTMGQGDQSERFRLLLEKELRRVAFEVADKVENADAILTGESGRRRTRFRSEAEHDSVVIPNSIPV
jgi:hypothetical protein